MGSDNPRATIGTLRIRLAGGSKADGARLAQDVAARLAEADTTHWTGGALKRVRIAAPRRGAPEAGTIADAIAAALKRQGGGDA